jgi:hypothetical protein
MFLGFFLFDPLPSYKSRSQYLIFKYERKTYFLLLYYLIRIVTVFPI